MSIPVLHSEDEHRIVLEAPRMASTLFGSLAALVLLAVWAVFPNHHVAQGVFVVLAVVGFTGLLHVHRLTLDLDARRWQYRDGWTWQAPRAEGSFDDLACVTVEENLISAGPAMSRLRSRMVFLEFGRFDVPGHDGRFPLGFAMGPNVAPARARHFAERLGVAVEDRVSESPPAPASDHPATPPAA